MKGDAAGTPAPAEPAPVNVLDGVWTGIVTLVDNTEVGIGKVTGSDSDTRKLSFEEWSADPCMVWATRGRSPGRRSCCPLGSGG